MPAGVTQLSIVNEALAFISSQTRVTSLTDPQQPVGIAAALLYAPTVQIILREIQPDFARLSAALSPSAAVTPIAPWSFEYLYPDDCVRLLQVMPVTWDAFDPQPVRAQVAFDIISAVNTKVILTNQASAVAWYISSAPDETLWDSTFQDAVVRRLANPLAMAQSGRPDFAREILMESAQMAATAEAVDDSGFRVRA